MIYKIFIDNGTSKHKKEEVTLNEQGIIGDKARNKLRQVLILPYKTINEFSTTPGELGENIILSESTSFDIHALPSGTVLNINNVKLRLTFHCEPCSKIKHISSAKKSYLKEAI